MEVISTSKWDDAFFAGFAELRNRIHSRNPYHLLETVEDLRKRFGPDAPFQRHNEWRAWIAKKDGRAVARGVASLPRSGFGGDFAPFGYFEAEDDPDAAAAVMDAAAEWARAKGKRELRGPINGSFFTGYRLRVGGGDRPFHGEPQTPAWYPALFERAGFEVSGYWNTTVADPVENLRAIGRFFRRFGKPAPEAAAGGKPDPRPLVHYRDLRFRKANLKDWDAELRLVHRLLTESFDRMPEFMPISFEEFRAEYDSFRYIAHRDLMWFAEHEGRTVAYLLAIRDPLPALLWHQRWERRLPKWARLPLQALTLARLRLGRGRLLVLYTGKIEYPEFRVKAVAARLMIRLMMASPTVFLRPPHWCYVATDSPSLASIPRGQRLTARYCVYRRRL